MIGLRASIVGIEGEQRKLGNIMSKEKIEDALEKAAILVEGEAKRMCPVGAPFGGRLQQSIRHFKSGSMQQTIIAQVAYSEYIEYGTARIAVGTPESPLVYASGAGKYPSYRPFLRAALHANMARINQLVNKILTQQ